MFETALLEQIRHEPYISETYLSFIIRRPVSKLSDEAAWLRLLAIQAGLEMLERERS